MKKKINYNKFCFTNSEQNSVEGFAEPNLYVILILRQGGLADSI